MLSVAQTGYMIWFTIHSHKPFYLYRQKVSTRLEMNAEERGGRDAQLKQVLMLTESSSNYSRIASSERK